MVAIGVLVAILAAGPAGNAVADVIFSTVNVSGLKVVFSPVSTALGAALVLASAWLVTAINTRANFNSAFGNQVLTDVSVTINSGDFVSIMGPSGSGKSTLLYCLSGMDPVDSGEIRLEDVDIATLSEDERTSLRGERMGFVFQDANLLESLNVLDNILFAAALRGHARMDELRARARELMELTGISGLEDRGVTEVSRGQRQRVSLCRALLHQPAVLFGDEPTGTLNSQASADVIALFHTLNAQGTTMLIVTTMRASPPAPRASSSSPMGAPSTRCTSCGTSLRASGRNGSARR